MSDAPNPTDLAALIGSRICHDLISPIGAISNGLELLTMSGGPSGPEMDLIADSAGNAGARIGFFRVAFGAAGDRVMSRAEVDRILTEMTAGTRFLPAWQPTEPQARRDVRLAFLAMQCCESALPYGGTLTFTHIDGWTVEGRADTVNVDPALWNGLNGAGVPDTITAATVQFALLPTLAAQERRPLAADWGKGRVTIRF